MHMCGEWVYSTIDTAPPSLSLSDWYIYTSLSLEDTGSLVLQPFREREHQRLATRLTVPHSPQVVV